MNCIYIIIFVIILFYLIFLYEDFDCIIKTCDSDYILKDNNCVKNINLYNLYNFTNCGATGRLGPTLEQCNKSYMSTTLKDNITMDKDRQGIQIWKVPITGRYLITVAGAGIIISESDKYYDDYSGGAVISSEFKLIKDDILKILVGQKGIQSEISQEFPQKENYSGSGGSFVVKCNNIKCDYDIINNIPLIIAGGAGGFNKNIIVSDKKNYNNSLLILTNASYTPIGNSGIKDFELNGGGKDGNGGSFSMVKYNDTIQNYNFGSGGGFKTNGKAIYDRDINNIYYYGQSFLNGGLGGELSPYLKNNYNKGEGGFGGGSSSLYNLCGNGGGYSGGGASVSYIGFGGGSYSSQKMNIIGYNHNDGYVDIKFLGE